MSNGETQILIAGASGPAFERFLEITSQPGFPAELETIAAARPEKRGKLLGETAVRNVSGYGDVRIASMEEAIRNTEADVAVSFLQNDAAAQYERFLAETTGLLIANSAFHRMDDDAALTSLYTNVEQAEELLQDDEQPYKIWTVGNCTSLMAGPPLAAIHGQWHILGAEIETLQDWSGAGKFELPKGRGGQAPIDIEGDEKEKIETEPRRLLSPTRSALANITSIKATPKRGPWWGQGHHEKITVELAEPATKKQVREAWREWRSPEVLKDMEYGPDSPKYKPIEVVKKPLVHWDSDVPSLTTTAHPMRVKAYVREVQEDGHVVIFDVLGDNLALGAAGSAAMNVAYAKEMGYLS